MVSGEQSVTCTGCGADLGIRRVRRHRQGSDSVAYYGSRTLPVRRVERRRQDPNAPATRPSTSSSNSTPWAWLKRALARGVPMQAQQTNEVPHPEAQGLMQFDIPEQPRSLPFVNQSPRRPWFEGAHVRVGPIRPDGTSHPHAGKTGRIAKFADGYSEPYWLGRPSAMIKLDSVIMTQRFIWVSLQCLEALPEEIHDADS